jgi:hypothetical protein
MTHLAKSLCKDDLSKQLCLNVGHYKSQAALGEQRESKRSTSPRAVIGTSTRDGQAKVRNHAI